MNETQGTFSTTSIPLGELVGLRNDLRGLHSNSRGTKMALLWLDSNIDTASRAAHPAAYANEKDTPRAIEPHAATVAAEKWLSEQPKTVTGETMGAQTARFTASIALPAAAPAPAAPLQFKPLLNNLSERKHSHYFKKCPYDAIDVYRVLSLFGVTDPAIAHAVKKLLVAGGRGAGKTRFEDIQEAIDTLERWKEMSLEDVNAGLELLEITKA